MRGGFVTLYAIEERVAALRPDLPFHAVVEYLIRHWTGPNTVYCAYKILTAIGPLGLRDLQTMVVMLDLAQVLKHKWALECGTDRVYVRGDITEVLLDNRYQDPATGEVVVKARHKLVLLYEPGPALNDWMYAAEEPVHAGSSAA